MFVSTYGLSLAARVTITRQQVEAAILIGTTNETTYLMSQTGNRRFWSVPTPKIDLAGLRADRDQLWGEAATLEAQGVSNHLPEEFHSVAAEDQDERRIKDGMIGRTILPTSPATLCRLLLAPKSGSWRRDFGESCKSRRTR
jgi:hypothetical protein